MYSFTRVAPDRQALEEPVEHLLPPLADMLPDDFDLPAADDLTVGAACFWANPRLSLEETMTRNAILEAWRRGAAGGVETVYALLERDAFDFDLAMQLLSDHAVALSKMDEVAPSQSPSLTDGRAR